MKRAGNRSGMSDSLSKHEIEDVLTSIRRLVSQEVARSNADRLLLTPALRVVSGSAVPTGDAPGEVAPSGAGAADSAGARPAEAPAPRPDVSERGNASAREAEAARDEGALPEAAFGTASTSVSGAAGGTMAEPGPVAGGDDELVIDENTLRDLVAQLLREELHGAMGERLTRSIRKLVRAEVARALSEREFL